MKMSNTFNIYKGVPNPMQLVLVPKSVIDLSSAKLEIFNFQKTKVYSFYVGNGKKTYNELIRLTKYPTKLYIPCY